MDEITREEALEYAKISCLARGCICEPDIEISEEGNGNKAVLIKHDIWCPAHPNYRLGRP